MKENGKSRLHSDSTLDRTYQDISPCTACKRRELSIHYIIGCLGSGDVGNSPRGSVSSGQDSQVQLKEFVKKLHKRVRRLMWNGLNKGRNNLHDRLPLHFLYTRAQYLPFFRITRRLLARGRLGPGSNTTRGLRGHIVPLAAPTRTYRATLGRSPARSSRLSSPSSSTISDGNSVSLCVQYTLYLHRLVVGPGVPQPC